MTRGKKLLILTGVLVVLAVSALLITKNADENAGEAYDCVFTLDIGTVTELSWTYDGETVSVSKADDGWVCDTDEALTVDDDKISSMLSALTEITAYKIIQNPSDLAQYGLEDTAVAVDVTAGESYGLRLGSISELDGELYISVGDGNVYLTDSTLLDSFSCTRYSIVQKEVVPDMSSLKSLSIPERELEIYYIENSGYSYNDTDTWFALKDGKYIALDNSSAETFVDYYKYLEWGDCVCYTASEEDLAEYGFDSPDAVVTVDYTDSDDNDAQFILEVSEFEDYCLGHIPGSKLVYLLSSGAGDSALNASLDSLLPTTLLSLDMSTVDSVDLILDGKSYVIECSYDDEQGAYIYTCADSEIDFGTVMSGLSYMTLNSYTDSSTSGREELKLTFHRSTDSFPTLTVLFSSFSDSEYLVSMDSAPDRTVSKEDVQSLISDIGSILK